jgi:hypothetical protein
MNQTQLAGEHHRLQESVEGDVSEPALGKKSQALQHDNVTLAVVPFSAASLAAPFQTSAVSHVRCYQAKVRQG